MTTSAIVLAAGEGRRLGGVAKAALLLPDGTTFAQAIARTARAAGCDRLVLVVGAPHREASIAAAADAYDAIVVNPDPSRGMASSVAAGLESERAEVVLIWPVDHAYVRESTVSAILAAARPDRIVVPAHAGRGGHPTAVGSDFIPALLAAVDAPDGIRSVVKTAATRLTVDDPGVWQDVDVRAGA